MGERLLRSACDVHRWGDCLVDFRRRLTGPKGWLPTSSGGVTGAHRLHGDDRRLRRQCPGGVVLGLDASELFNRQRWRTNLQLSIGMADYMETSSTWADTRAP
jgi:hypothetical protein